eukprot:Rhum_TRINITY_DN15125_c26_g1::Rhum_TRINITY_DN15125_c26_g1_i1::g.138281::m.138281
MGRFPSVSCHVLPSRLKLSHPLPLCRILHLRHAPLHRLLHRVHRLVLQHTPRLRVVVRKAHARRVLRRPRQHLQARPRKASPRHVPTAHQRHTLQEQAQQLEEATRRARGSVVRTLRLVEVAPEAVEHLVVADRKPVAHPERLSCHACRPLAEASLRLEEPQHHVVHVDPVDAGGGVRAHVALVLHHPVDHAAVAVPEDAAARPHRHRLQPVRPRFVRVQHGLLALRLRPPVVVRRRRPRHVRPRLVDALLDLRRRHDVRRRRDDQTLHARGPARLRHVARALDVDGVAADRLEAEALPEANDGEGCEHGVDAHACLCDVLLLRHVALDVYQRGVPLLQLPDVRQRLGAQVEAGDVRLTALQQALHQHPAQEARADNEVRLAGAGAVCRLRGPVALLVARPVPLPLPCQPRRRLGTRHQQPCDGEPRQHQRPRRRQRRARLQPGCDNGPDGPEQQVVPEAVAVRGHRHQRKKDKHVAADRRAHCERRAVVRGTRGDRRRCKRRNRVLEPGVQGCCRAA